jgi:DNA-binding transcriptional LysR family regulator
MCSTGVSGAPRSASYCSGTVPASMLSFPLVRIHQRPLVSGRSKRYRSRNSSRYRFPDQRRRCAGGSAEGGDRNCALPQSTAVPALRDGSLVRVLPDYRLQPLTVYVLYASRRHLHARMRTFVDFLREFIPQLREADEGVLRDIARTSRLAISTREYDSRTQ